MTETPHRGEAAPLLARSPTARRERRIQRGLDERHQRRGERCGHVPVIEVDDGAADDGVTGGGRAQHVGGVEHPDEPAHLGGRRVGERVRLDGGVPGLVAVRAALRGRGDAVRHARREGRGVAHHQDREPGVGEDLEGAGVRLLGDGVLLGGGTSARRSVRADITHEVVAARGDLVADPRVPVPAPLGGRGVVEGQRGVDRVADRRDERGDLPAALVGDRGQRREPAPPRASCRPGRRGHRRRPGRRRRPRGTRTAARSSTGRRRGGTCRQRRSAAGSGAAR